MRGRQHGFTMIEIAVVLAIVAILAAAAYPIFRAATRNASVGATATELQMRLEGLPYKAMSDQRDYLFVLADTPNNDASQCGSIADAGCVRVFVLREPDATWTLASFDVSSPGNGAKVVDEFRLGKGIHFYLPAATATPLPPPFDQIATLLSDGTSSLKTFDSDLTPTCPGARRCLAFRFRPGGAVELEPPDRSAPPSDLAAKNGHAFALGSDMDDQTRGADQRAVLVAVPSGLVKAYGVARVP
ncbi:prepilin-type N-terminal cleavage/methylation domain-containing protein [Anaeromyxobacter oryzisoli]|uniref:prepilin-type N-terminal cleavage/methylation domain-containing protein n=1 Tax=Anaeromyxobacter oryzisoli TaxID=2925408 RepID=UPI001F582D22|nr:prepilin-type N-terminal cleavage/methylation domain-containing protein [Anaeromyxobacter sp. SG63]